MIRHNNNTRSQNGVFDDNWLVGIYMDFVKKLLLFLGLSVMLSVLYPSVFSNTAHAVSYSCGSNWGWLPYTYRKHLGQNFTQYNRCGSTRSAVGTKNNANYQNMYPVPARSSVCKNTPYNVNYYLNGSLYKPGGAEYGTKTGTGWTPSRSNICSTATLTQTNNCPGQSRVVSGTMNCDVDSDGVVNSSDQCPSTPSGQPVNTVGCAQSQIDSDQDGSFNDVDQCPNTPQGETANAIGCSLSQLDTDADGVSDAIDQCASTPSGESVDANGCGLSQLDTDNDGVTDDIDQCPSTPSGESVDANGCGLSQLDSDVDGVNDLLDLCPATPVGESVDSDGCSVAQASPDTDGDGVKDYLDLCPSTPSGDTANAEGCSPDQIDTDGDGIPDNQDSYPHQSGTECSA